MFDDRDAVSGGRDFVSRNAHGLCPGGVRGRHCSRWRKTRRRVASRAIGRGGNSGQDSHVCYPGPIAVFLTACSVGAVQRQLPTVI